MRALAAEYPAVPQYRRDLAVSHDRVGGLLECTGDLAGALAEQTEVPGAGARPWPPTYPDVSDYRRDLALSHIEVGGLLTLPGGPPRPSAELERARSLLRGSRPGRPECPRLSR